MIQAVFLVYKRLWSMQMPLLQLPDFSPWGRTLLRGMLRYVYVPGLLTSITAELGTLTTWAIIPFQTDPTQKF